MHGSMRELMRLKLRAKIYSPFIGLGIIFVALGIILGLAEDDPLAVGNHTYSMILGMLSIFLEFYCIRMKSRLHKNMT